jgi:hypothetical protein
MAIRQPRARVLRLRRRSGTIDSRAIVIGVTSLALVAVVFVSALVGTYVNAFLAGWVLGAGLIGSAWGVATWWRLRTMRPRVPGRSNTLDCRQARWSRSVPTLGKPHPATSSQRRVRSCRGSRRS